MPPARPLVADACCLLNLLGTGREVDLVLAAGCSLLVTPQARAEVRYLAVAPDESGDPTQEPVDLSPLEAASLLKLQPMGPEALDVYVECAASLPDADASCVALAAALGVPLATDDAKERRVAARLVPNIQIVSTLELVRAAADRLRLTGAPLRQLAQGLRRRANFAPPRSDPQRDWFAALLRDDE